MFHTIPAVALLAHLIVLLTLSLEGCGSGGSKPNSKHQVESIQADEEIVEDAVKASGHDVPKEAAQQSMQHQLQAESQAGAVCDEFLAGQRATWELAVKPKAPKVLDQLSDKIKDAMGLCVVMATAMAQIHSLPEEATPEFIDGIANEFFNDMLMKPENAAFHEQLIEQGKAVLTKPEVLEKLRKDYALQDVSDEEIVAFKTVELEQLLERLQAISAKKGCCLHHYEDHCKQAAREAEAKFMADQQKATVKDGATAATPGATSVPGPSSKPVDGGEDPTADVASAVSEDGSDSDGATAATPGATSTPGPSSKPVKGGDKTIAPSSALQTSENENDGSARAGERMSPSRLPRPAASRGARGASKATLQIIEVRGRSLVKLNPSESTRRWKAPRRQKAKSDNRSAGAV